MLLSTNYFLLSTIYYVNYLSAKEKKEKKNPWIFEEKKDKDRKKDFKEKKEEGKTEIDCIVNSNPE